MGSWLVVLGAATAIQLGNKTPTSSHSQVEKWDFWFWVGRSESRIPFLQGLLVRMNRMNRIGSNHAVGYGLGNNFCHGKKDR
jgi:uncharacterized membrane protein